MPDDLEDQVIEFQSQICKTLANPKRLKIIYILKEGEKSVGELAERLGLPYPNVSQHLGALQDKGIVESRWEGQNIYYRLPDARITQACDMMRRLLMERLMKMGELAKVGSLME